MALLLGAAAAKAAYDYGPAIYSGLKNEVKTMKHSKKHGLAKLGQGFSSSPDLSTSRPVQNT